MRFLLLRLVVFGLLAAPSRSFAQTDSGFDSTVVIDLSWLLARAQEHPAVRASRIDAEAMATRPAQVGALPDPTISAGYRPFAIGSATGVLPAQFMAEQMIPYPGKLTAVADVERLAARAAAEEPRIMALDLMQEIQEAYYTLYRIQEQDRLASEFILRLRDFEEAATVRYEVGQDPQMPILKAQVERLALERKRLNYAAERRTALESLARLTNLPDLASASEVALVSPNMDLELDLSIDSALTRRPEAAALRLSQQQAGREIEMARLEYRPDFMIGVGLMDMPVMDERVRPLSSPAERFAVQVGIVVPLQTGKRRAAIQEATIKRQAIDARLEALETEIETSVQALYASLRQDSEALRLYETALIPQAEAALQSTLSAYTTGQAEFLELLDSERMLYDMRMEREMTLERFAMSRARLERTLGVPPAASSPAQPLAEATDADAPTSN